MSTVLGGGFLFLRYWAGDCYLYGIGWGMVIYIYTVLNKRNIRYLFLRCWVHVRELVVIRNPKYVEFLNT